MVRYFYALTPLVIVGTVFILTLPWLGLAALLVFTLVALAALAALAWAIVVAPYLLVRSIARRWHGRSLAYQPQPGTYQPGAYHPSAALSLVPRERA